MCQCWLETPEERPTFTELHKFLRNLFESADNCSENDFPRLYTKDIKRDYYNDSADDAVCN